MKVLGLLLVLILVSCAPQKKLARLLKKHPELVFNDTLRIVDSVKAISPGVKTSQSEHVDRFPFHPIIIDSGQLHVSVYSIGDSIIVFGECDTVSIWVPYEVEVPIEKIRIEQQGFIEWLKANFELKWWHWFFFLLGLIGYAYFRARKDNPKSK